MGTDFVAAVTSLLTGVTGWFTSVFSAIGAILYTPGVGEAPGSLTVIGWLVSVIVSLSVVGFGIKFVMSLIKRIHA